MSHDIELYNFYRRYYWNEDDFTQWQAGMVNHSRGMFEGLLKGSVLKGLEISPSGSGLAVTISEGLASGPSGYFHYMNDATVVSFDPANSTYRRDLVVIRPNLINNTYINRPTNAFEQVPLKQEQASSIVVLKGVEANSPVYPSVEANDVVVCGVRVKAGVSPLILVDIDLEVRDTPGKNTSFQQNAAKYDDRLRPYRFSAGVMAIKPSQLNSPFPRAFTYVNKTNPSIFPKNGSNQYNGFGGDTFLNMKTGAITGADLASPDFTAQVPTAGNAIVATIGILTDDTLAVLYGTQGTRTQCLQGIINQSTAGAGSVGLSGNMKVIAFVIVFSADGTNVTEMDFVDARGTAVLGETAPAITKMYFTRDGSFLIPAGVTKMTTRLYRPAIGKLAASGNNTFGVVKNVERSVNGDVIYASGNNANGELGDGTVVAKSTPVVVSGLGYSAVFAKGDTGGGNAVFAISKTGRLYAWGLNSGGGLGDGTNTPRSTPTLISTPGDNQRIRLFDSGAQNAIMVNTARQVWTWGLNAKGQLGDGTNVAKSTPTFVSSLGSGLDFVQVSISPGSQAHCAALLSDGSVRMWGDNSKGQMGDGTTTPKSTPTLIAHGQVWKKIVCSNGSTLALNTLGKIYAWGDNTFGQLGDGTTVSKSTPTLINSGLTTAWTDIAAGADAFYAVDRAGNIAAWGNNDNGQLGDNTTTPQSTPIQIIGLGGVSGFIAAGDGGVTMHYNGTPYYVGRGTEGQGGNGAAIDVSTAVLFSTNQLHEVLNDEVISQKVFDVVPGIGYSLLFGDTDVRFGGTSLGPAHLGAYVEVEYVG